MPCHANPWTSGVLPTITVYSIPAVEAHNQPQYDVDAIVYYCMIGAMIAFFFGYWYSALLHGEELLYPAVKGGRVTTADSRTASCEQNALMP
jgi:hypothetical protein